MLALENIADAAWGGIAAFYSIIHLPRDHIALALREFYRVLVPRGIVLLAFHRGDDESLTETEIWGKAIRLEYIFFSRATIENTLRDAGFEILDSIERAPYAPDVEYQSRRVYIFAQKPEA